MKFHDTQQGVFVTSKGKIYKFDDVSECLKEVKVEDCDGTVIASIGTVDDE